MTEEIKKENTGNHSEAVFVDRTLTPLFLVGLICVIISYAVWKKWLESPDIYVYVRIGIYPIKFFAVIFILNSLLSFFVSGKDRKTAHLLLGTSLFIGLLIILLEILYLIH